MEDWFGGLDGGLDAGFPKGVAALITTEGGRAAEGCADGSPAGRALSSRPISSTYSNKKIKDVEQMSNRLARLGTDHQRSDGGGGDWILSLLTACAEFFVLQRHDFSSWPSLHGSFFLSFYLE